MDHNPCEFCLELRHDPSSRFAVAYAPAGFSSRVQHEVGGYVVLPTLGPIVRRSLLILPRQHRETLAGVGCELKAGLTAAIEWAGRFAAPDSGRYVVFEHGARRVTGAACGIYHAHAHVVPVSEDVLAADLLPEGATVDDVPEALDRLSDASAYLWFRGTSGDTRFLDLSDKPDAYPSQYFRRLLAERLGRPADWDWRRRAQPEDDVLAVLAG